ncbi:uncharacterized protein LOC131304814 isoform X2 [Rhododendron vialii]|uniref:uncharacterized protein LOC131304814 isoform X2 n=1 Tax=Rhododendron vialii TaxID=182163 RepID=UPI00265D6CF7|nr:uncharacterized protein LOC131304814 isoform X2 [Rhododendron vialii]
MHQISWRCPRTYVSRLAEIGTGLRSMEVCNLSTVSQSKTTVHHAQTASFSMLPDRKRYFEFIKLFTGTFVNMALLYHSWKCTDILWHSPHNPTGKVFTKDELETVAGACHTRDLLAITDEVYEHITYDKKKHISLASLPGMQKRTIITSSLSKTYSVTGWRVGWAVASACIASAIRNIHIKLTDSAPAPFQEAALTALRSPLEYFELLRRDYESRRDYTVKLLSGVGFQVQFKPEGSFFLFVELPENCVVSDVEFVEELIKQAGVVAVPGCGFFHRDLYLDKFFPADYSYQKRYIRFAFCKSDATLAAAAQKIGELVNSSGLLKLFHSDRKMQ